LCPGRLAAKLRSIEEVFRAESEEERESLAHAMEDAVVPLAGAAVGPDGGGRLKDLAEAPAHRATTVVSPTTTLAQQKDSLKVHLAQVQWRTTAHEPPQLGAARGDAPGPLDSMSKIK